MTKIRKEQINSGNAPDGYVLTADGSGNANWESVTGSSGGGGSSSSLPIFDDGIFKITGSAISFDSNLSVIVTGSVAFVSSAAGGGLSSIPIYDNHVFKASGTVLDFTENLLIAVTGSSVFISTIFGSGSASVIGAKVRRNLLTVFTFTGGFVPIPIQFDDERWDNGNLFDASVSGTSSRFNITEEGYYLIAGTADFQESTGDTRELSIFRNGTFELVRDRNSYPSISEYQSYGVACIQYLNSLDYVELRVNKSGSGTSKVGHVDKTISSPEFSIQKLDNIRFISTGTFISNQFAPENTLAIYDDGLYKVTGSYISFNKYLDVTASGTTAQIDVNIPDGLFASGSHTHPAGSAAISIFEDSVFKATGTAISFNDNLDVSVSGTTAFVNAVGGSSIQGTTVMITGAFLIENTTITPLQWQIEVIDELGFWSVGDNTKMLINATNWYMLSCYANWSANTAGTRKLDIISSGTAGVNTLGSNKNSATGGDNTNTVSAIERLISGSYVYVSVYQDSGGQRQVEDCRWSIAKL